MTNKTTLKKPKKALEASTAAPPPAANDENKPEEPERHKIYVRYSIGSKGRPGSRIMNATFDNLNTEENLTQAVAFLQQEHGGKEIHLDSWAPLDG